MNTQNEPAFRSAVIQQDRQWNNEGNRERGIGIPDGHEEISMMNLNKTNHFPTKIEEDEAEILSPFMALSNHRREAAATFSSQITVKNHDKDIKPEVQPPTTTSLINPFKN